MRTKYRKFGRKAGVTNNTSHVVKIGHRVEKISKKTGKPYKGPGKLNGFLICRDTRDTDGNLVVDVDSMLRLGEKFDAKAIAEAKRLELKAPDGVLPRELHFAIPSDSTRVPGNGWEHPGSFTEGYQCWNKAGLFCSGDGEWASRKQNNGTQKRIACVPVGKEGGAPETFCEESEAGDCKHNCCLTLSLFVLAENGEPEPLSQSLGWSARYRLGTTSEAAAMRAGEELDRAAELLDGHLHGITGVLVFARQSRRTGKVATPVGITGQIMFMLSEPDIARREQQIHNRYIEQHQAKFLEGPKADPFAAPAGETENWNGEEEPEAEDPVTVEPVEEEPEPEPEDDGPKFSDGPEMVGQDQAVRILELSEAYKIDLMPTLAKARIDTSGVDKVGFPQVSALTREQADKTEEWLREKDPEGETT